MVPVAMVNNSVAIWKNLPGLPLAGILLGLRYGTMVYNSMVINRTSVPDGMQRLLSSCQPGGCAFEKGSSKCIWAVMHFPLIILLASGQGG